MTSEALPCRVRVLDEAVANQIAAGEVVERPASVVKELAENSVDAGATRITVDLEDGGRRLVRVVDNGGGMSAQEAVLSLQRHATSKITQADDLLAVRTLGFRGEALPSIAGVSRLTLVTRARGDLEGTRLEVEGGEIRTLEAVGAPEGTSIAVADLFYNTPARLKFLKAPRTELGQACDALTRIALARSDIAVTLRHEGGEVLGSPGGGDLLNAIVALYGAELARELLPLAWERGGIRVGGFVSKPSYTRPTRSAQSFFVNGRFVRSRTLIHALDEAYRGTMPAGRFPAAVVLLDVDPTLVDVNVHPTKAEVRFLRDWEAHRTLHEAIKAALGLPSLGSPTPLVRQSSVSQEDLASGLWAEGIGPRGEGPEPAEHSAAFAAQPSIPGVEPAPAALRPIAQLWNSYILAEGPSGLLIIDQHLAHERVLYQRLLAEGESRLAVQRLVVPLTLQLPRREAVLVEAALPELMALGFELEPFGNDTYVLRGTPSCIGQGEELATLRGIIESMVEEPAGRRAAIPRERVAATAACKAAIKKGMRLAPEEMRQLLEDLAHVEHGHTCPHGCPIAVELGYQELLKRFRRA